MRVSSVLTAGLITLTACVGPGEGSGETAATGDPMSVMLEVEGADLEAWVWGPGETETVVALPGLGNDVAWFRLVAPEIAGAGFRVVAINPRGVRGSRGALDALTIDVLAEDVANALAALDVTKAHLLGWAFGNRVARATAQNHPDRVATVTLLAAGGLVPPSEPVMAAFNQLSDPGLADSTRLRLRQKALYAATSDVARIESAIQPGSWPAARAAQRSAMSGARVEAWWSGGAAPMLIVQGRYDVMAPPENGMALHEAFPGRTSLVWVEDAGHMLLAEQPTAVAEHVVRFLRDHAVGFSTNGAL